MSSKLQVVPNVYSRAELENILSEAQIHFVEHYVYDYNKSAAYRNSFKKGQLSSPQQNCKSADVLLRKPEIAQYVAILKNDIAGQANVSKIMLINELRKIATSNIAHFHNTWIDRKQFDELTEDQKSAIQEISTKVITTLDEQERPIQVEYVKIKMYDKRQAANDIMRAMGWIETPDTQVNIQIGEKRIGRVQVVKPTATQKGIDE